MREQSNMWMMYAAGARRWRRHWMSRSQPWCWCVQKDVNHSDQQLQLEMWYERHKQSLSWCNCNELPAWNMFGTGIMAVFFVQCHHGVRSMQAADFLVSQVGMHDAARTSRLHEYFFLVMHPGLLPNCISTFSFGTHLQSRQRDLVSYPGTSCLTTPCSESMFWMYVQRIRVALISIDNCSIDNCWLLRRDFVTWRTSPVGLTDIRRSATKQYHCINFCPESC